MGFFSMDISYLVWLKGGVFSVDGADEKKEIGTDLYGTLMALFFSKILEGCECDKFLVCSCSIRLVSFLI